MSFPVAALWLLFGPSRSHIIGKHFWSPVLLWAGGARLEIDGLEHIKPNQPYIFVSNHQSSIDIPALFAAIPVSARFIAKHQLRYVPFIGWWMTLAGFIYVDRRDSRRAIASLSVAADRIRAGSSILAFAEGTRSDDCRVHPFKKGPFALAIAAGVPVVPITIEGSGRLMPKNSWVITPGPIRVSLGTPIHPEAANWNRETLRAMAHRVVVDRSIQLGGLGEATSTGDGSSQV